MKHQCSLFGLIRLLFSIAIALWAAPYSFADIHAAETLKTETAPPMPAISSCPIRSGYVLPRDLDRVIHSVVIVQNGGNIGTGVVISPEGHILTAAHVLSGAKQAVVYMHSGAVETGQIYRSKRSQDIAVLKLNIPTPACLNVRKGRLPIGAPIYGIGFNTRQGGGFLWRQGQVQGYRWVGLPAMPYIETAMNLTAGNSGGPLLDNQGRVAGIISWKRNVGEHATYAYGAVTNQIDPLLQISLQK